MTNASKLFKMENLMQNGETGLPVFGGSRFSFHSLGLLFLKQD